jgi:hypothetical protein
MEIFGHVWAIHNPVLDFGFPWIYAVAFWKIYSGMIRG